MDLVLQLFSSPWIYAVLSVLVAVISVLGAYFYTRYQQKQLLAQINEQVKVQSKDNKEAVTENVKGPDAWPTEEAEKGKAVCKICFKSIQSFGLANSETNLSRRL